MDKDKVLAKLLKKTSKIEGGHWLYLGYSRPAGYGRFSVYNTVIDVHRLSAHIYLGLDLDNPKELALHKRECNYKNCWNPEHLYVGTQRQNIQDALVKFGGRIGGPSKQTHCKQGHLLSADNIYKRPGTKLCKICHLERQRKYQERKNNAKG